MIINTIKSIVIREGWWKKRKRELAVRCVCVCVCEGVCERGRLSMIWELRRFYKKDI